MKTDSSKDRHGPDPPVLPYGGARVTAQRRRIAETAARIGAFTVEDLATRLACDPPGLPLATIYRAVGAMEAAGSVQRAGSRGSSALYVWCEAEGHHHHLVCTGCGAVEHAPCPFGVEPMPTQMAGYTVTKHEVTLYGLCAECGAKESTDSPGPRSEAE